MRSGAGAALIWWLQHVQGVRNPLDGRGLLAVADENQGLLALFGWKRWERLDSSRGVSFFMR
jgi:hypothetical protein